MHLQKAVKFGAKFLKLIAYPYYIKGRKNPLHIAQLRTTNRRHTRKKMINTN